MKKIGITGNIGSGKSLVCSIFEAIRTPVFYADKEAKLLYSKPEIFDRMVNYFGKSIYNTDKTIRPVVLAKKIFNQPQSLNFVNSIIHPSVHIRFNEWIQAYQSVAYILYEAAILYETGFDKEFDAIIVVTAPEPIRLERIMQRDHLTQKEVKIRMERQWPEEKKSSMADYIILNDGNSLLIPQVLKIHNQLTH